MPLRSTSRFPSTVLHSANRLLPALVPAVAVFLVAVQPARPCAAQDAPPAVSPLSRQNLVQVPLQVAIHSAIEKAKQDAQAAPAATKNAPGKAAPSTPPNSAQNDSQSGSVNANPTAGSNQAQPGSIPPRIQDGITALLSARASLEQAGSKWGGHKDTAIKLIDQALEVCGQAQPSAGGGVKSAAADQSPAMQAGFTQLTAAQSDFENAKNPWDGRRDQALALIKQAVSEVQAGIDYAKSHNTY